MSLDFADLSLARVDNPAVEPTHDVQAIALGLIDDDPEQPRQDMDEESLAELAESIKRHGLLHPVVLLPVLNGRFVTVVGARRVRAAKMAGLDTIAAFVREPTDAQLRDIQIAENIHRENLKPHEMAKVIEARLSNGQSKSAIARALGKSKAFVSKYARMIALPTPIKRLYDEGLVTEINAIAELARAFDKDPAQIEALCGAIKVPMTRALLEAHLARAQIGQKPVSRLREFDDSTIFDDVAEAGDEAAPTFIASEIVTEASSSRAERSSPAVPSPRKIKWDLRVTVGKEPGKIVSEGAAAIPATSVMVAFDSGPIEAVPAGRVTLLGAVSK